MKRIFVILLTFVLLLGICPMSALAETGGSGNVDGGGGDMGQGTSQNSWNPGMDGVRITVVDAESGQPVSSSFDLTNKTPSIKIHFGKVSKIQYANGASISPTTGNYDYYTPATPMPRIVSSGSQNASIEAIKKYFCSEYAVKLVAQQTGIAYEELIGGQYKLFLEPIAYFKHNGIMMAMTAHEAALYDNQAGGSLRKTMTSLTHKNLPLAMFLEYADMGFPAYTGATNKTCSNDTIITYLGMGIVWFTDPPEQPEPTDYDYEYRVDTDVITPVTLYAGSEINPDSPATVSFSINGSTYRMNNIVIPSGDSQIAWVKWHTPSEPQDITIYVSTNKGSLSQSTIRAKVVDLSGNDPPDPKATDTMGSWSASSVPSRETKTYAAWSVWWAKWHPYWVWHSTGKNTGYWVDDGWYDYFRDNYSASMTATTRIEPDEKVPTASGDLMKSGYEGNGMSDMALHMKTLEIEFSLYLPSLTDMQKAILKQTIIELYNQFGIFWETDIRQLKATDFPILSDLHALLEKKAEANKENPVYRDLAMLLYDAAAGSDSFLWNGHTTLEANSRFICLDTHDLQNASDNVKRTQYLNLLSWCWEEMSRDRNERCLLVCDEAYLMIDPQVPQSLVFLRNVEKRARKYEAGLAIISHSVVDFLAPEVKMYGQALLDIPCYKILMGCDGKNLQETKDLYNLTDAEQELLESKRRGHALFIIGSKRLHVNFEIPAYKFSYMGKAGGR